MEKSKGPDARNGRPPALTKTNARCRVHSAPNLSLTGETNGTREGRERERERKGKRVGRSKERAWRVKFIHKKENYYARGEATPAKWIMPAALPPFAFQFNSNSVWLPGRHGPRLLNDDYPYSFLFLSIFLFLSLLPFLLLLSFSLSRSSSRSSAINFPPSYAVEGHLSVRFSVHHRKWKGI